MPCQRRHADARDPIEIARRGSETHIEGEKLWIRDRDRDRDRGAGLVLVGCDGWREYGRALGPTLQACATWSARTTTDLGRCACPARSTTPWRRWTPSPLPRCAARRRPATACCARATSTPSSGGSAGSTTTRCGTRVIATTRPRGGSSSCRPRARGRPPRRPRRPGWLAERRVRSPARARHGPAHRRQGPRPVRLRLCSRGHTPECAPRRQSIDAPPTHRRPREVP